MTTRIDLVVTAGTVDIDGRTWPIENNVWLVGDDSKVIVIDAAHEVGPIVQEIGRRYVVGIVSTHAHSDHINAAPELSRSCGGRVLLHPDDEPLWRLTHPDLRWAGDLSDGGMLRVGNTMLEIIHTPGHTPGSICLYVPQINALFSGDTLFAGGPGATRRPFGNYQAIVESIQKRLLVLPEETIIYPGHGALSTIGEETINFQNLIVKTHQSN